MEKKIITIGREFGSGGHEIGERLAKALRIPFYDKNLILKVAGKLHLTEKEVARVDENAISDMTAAYMAHCENVLRSKREYDRFFFDEGAENLPNLVYGQQEQIILAPA